LVILEIYMRLGREVRLRFVSVQNRKGLAAGQPRSYDSVTANK